VICAVLECDPAELLVPEPDKVAARRPKSHKAASKGTSPAVQPRFGKAKPEPPL
jgi:putative transcriptional regulator